MKYLPWVLVALLGAALLWGLFAQPSEAPIGTVNLSRIVDESARAQELNELLSKRYNELIIEFDLDGEPDPDEADRIERERRAYGEYLAFRQGLEAQFQTEVDEAVREVAKSKKISVVVDEDVVRYGGIDLSSEVIKRLN